MGIYEQMEENRVRPGTAITSVNCRSSCGSTNSGWSTTSRGSFSSGVGMGKIGECPPRRDKRLPLGGELGTVTIRRVFKNFKIDIKEDEPVAYDEPGGSNPALEVAIERPGAKPGRRYVFERRPGHANPDDPLAMSYRRNVKDYISELEIVKDGQVVAAKNIEVNHPLYYGGYHFYQTSMGRRSAWRVHRPAGGLRFRPEHRLRRVRAADRRGLLALLGPAGPGPAQGPPHNHDANPRGISIKAPMEIKYTIQGLLIYATIAAYLLAFVTTVARRARAGRDAFHRRLSRQRSSPSSIAGPRATRAAAKPLRGLSLPGRGLLSDFLVQPACPADRRPVGRHADRSHRALPGGFRVQRRADAIAAGPAKLAVRPARGGLHVLLYFMLKAAFQAAEQLLTERPRIEQMLIPPEQATYELIAIGFPLLTLGLVLGSWWGKLAWGRYWGWDPKELWSLASWLVYVGYFHWRYMFGTRRPRMNSVWAIAGMAGDHHHAAVGESVENLRGHA